MPNTPSAQSIEEARGQLANRGLPFSEEHFLRQVRGGSLDLIALYLRAGISPNAKLDGESALAVAANAKLLDVARLLLDWGADPLGITEGLKTDTKRKDAWEKLSSLSGVFTFTSSLVVAAIGWYFTSAYNGRQLELSALQAKRDQETKDYQNRLAEMQTVEKMIPHLVKDESSKRAALIAISALATPKLASQIAEAYGGTGSIEALAQIATTNTPSRPTAPAVAALTALASAERGATYRPAQTALAGVLAGRDRAVVKVHVSGTFVCQGFVVDGKRGWIATPNYCLSVHKEQGMPQIEFNDGAKVAVKSLRKSQDGLLALLEVGMKGLPDIELATVTPSVGSTVVQLAVDPATRAPSVVLGSVLEAKSFAFYDGSRGGVPATSAPGLLVKIEGGAHKDQLGKAGAPLLDKLGNVACMTFQGADNMEQCLAASVLAEAVKALPG